MSRKCTGGEQGAMPLLLGWKKRESDGVVIETGGNDQVL
jgi:hypothetical protein